MQIWQTGIASPSTTAGSNRRFSDDSLTGANDEAASVSRRSVNVETETDSLVEGILTEAWFAWFPSSRFGVQ